MNTHYDASMLKWVTIRNTLDKLDITQKTPTDMMEYWENFIWQRCGFCTEFSLKKGDMCKPCPLNTKSCAAKLTTCMTHENLISKFYSALINMDFDEAIKFADQFIDEMRKHKMKFKHITYQ